MELYEEVRNALSQVETILEQGEQAIRSSVDALDDIMSPVDEFLDSFAGVLARLKTEVDNLDPGHEHKAELVSLLAEVQGKVDELRAL